MRQKGFVNPAPQILMAKKGGDVGRVDPYHEQVCPQSHQPNIPSKPLQTLEISFWVCKPFLRTHLSMQGAEVCFLSFFRSPANPSGRWSTDFSCSRLGVCQEARQQVSIASRPVRPVGFQFQGQGRGVGLRFYFQSISHNHWSRHRSADFSASGRATGKL